MKQGWEIKKLGEVCAKLTDGSHNPPKGVNHGNFIMLSSQNIFNDYLSYDDVRFLQEEDFIREDKRTCVREGDVLLTIVGTIGRCAVFTGSKNVTLQRSVAVLHPHESLLSRFLMYCLIGRNTSLNEQAHGIAQKGIYLKQLALITIPVPPLPEQEKIVSELDCLSGILEKKRQQLKELDALAQSIFYEMFGDPVTNEREWEVKEIQEIFKVTSSKRILQSEWKENGIPFFKVAEIVALIKGEKINPSVFIDETNYEELCKANLVPTEGDILITSRGTLGQCYIVKKGDRFYFQDGMITWLSPKKNLATPIFTKGVFLNDSFFESLSNIANNSTIAYISIKQLSKMRLILPPLPLQQTFATKIEAIESQKALIKQSLGEVETLFNSRMQEYFG